MGKRVDIVLHSGLLEDFDSGHGLDGSGWAIEKEDIRVSHDALPRLCEALSIPPGLTADEAEVAMIERELEQAVADDIVQFWVFHRYTDKDLFQRYDVWPMPKWSRREMFGGNARLEAARAVAARVAELRAEAKRLPPDEMSAEECYWELTKRGWRVVLLRDIRAWVTPCNKYEYDQKDTETTEAHNRRMVAVARELDAQK